MRNIHSLAFLVAIAFTLFTLQSGISEAQSVVFGPSLYFGESVTPGTVTETFSVSTPGDFTLFVSPADGGGERLNAVIRINGVRVFSPLNSRGEQTVSLEENNEISILVRGDRTISVRIEGYVEFGSIQGIVLQADGSVAGGAAVTLDFPQSGLQWNGDTDSEGIFSFQDLPLGVGYVLTAELDGARASQGGIIPESNPNEFANVVLLPLGEGIVSGEVLSVGGLPAPNVILSLEFMETGFKASTSTDSEGLYSFVDLPADGSFFLSAVDPASGAFDSSFSFLTSGTSEQVLSFSLRDPVVVNPELTNGDFSSGDAEGWETDGEILILPQDEVFPPAMPLGEGGEKDFDEESIDSKGACNPDPFSAVVTTAGDSNAAGTISQTFTVGPGQDTLVGRIRFVSNEYPVYVGSEFNDSYSVSLHTPSGTRILGKGNVNSSSWSSGVAGFNGATPEVVVSEDVSSFVGQNLTLIVKVSDVGDLIVDSGVALSDFKIINQNNRNFYAAGAWNGNTSFNASLGQAVWITVKNVNVLGTTIRISDQFGQTQEIILLPLLSHTFKFAVFGEEPLGWQFNVSTISDAFIVGYKIESTWIPGMPPNPCP